MFRFLGFKNNKNNKEYFVHKGDGYIEICIQIILWVVVNIYLKYYMSRDIPALTSTRQL